TGDHAGALTLVDRAFEIHRTAGLATPVDWYRRAISMAQGLNDVGRISAYGQSMLSEHPTQRNWRDVLIQHRAAYAADPEAAIDLWRLQEAAGALTGEFDYRDYARVANGRGLPAEIERIVQAGRANNMLDGGNSEIATLDRGTTAAAQRLRSALPGRAQAAAAAATGANAMSAADDYVSLGDYAAAIPLYRAAIEKGSIDTELANIRLGMALARTGDAAGARTALDQVVGPRASIARLWRIYVDMPRAASTPVAQETTASE
ncbi:MAG: tetratricopeptide repeat protein, partial [Parasphingopyxis sp.]